MQSCLIHIFNGFIMMLNFTHTFRNGQWCSQNDLSVQQAYRRQKTGKRKEEENKGRRK